jgi:hypothetical protein
MDFPVIRTGVWLVTGTALTERYPCRCWEDRDGWVHRNRPERCPCCGRLDVGNVPPSCCALSWSGLAAALANSRHVG